MTDAIDSPNDPAPARFSWQMIVLDICERAVVFVAFIRFAFVMLSGAAENSNILDVLLVFGEVIPIVLIMIRPRSATLSRRPTDWLYGLSAVILPLMVWPANVAPLVPATLCFFIMVAGTFVQIASKVVLGRSFGVIAANRGVVTLGPYRLVRHPMYLGYAITHFGFLLSNPTATVAIIYGLTLCVQIGRLLREENVLMRDEVYRAFAGRVRYRLLPHVF